MIDVVLHRWVLLVVSWQAARPSVPFIAESPREYLVLRTGKEEGSTSMSTRAQ